MKPIYKKVYMLAPLSKHTGGIELAHQFVHKLRELGQEAYIVYVQGDYISEDQSITPQYQKYNIKSTNVIEDSDENFLMMPEVFFNFIKTYNNINLGCWWMSVDNRYWKSGVWDNFKFKKRLKSKLSILAKYYQYLPNISDKKLKGLNHRIVHFYQSIYAQNHLIKKGFSQILPLGDYINKEFFPSERISEKHKTDIVLYNPVKGYAFTKKIIDANKDTKFIPLKGFSRKELSKIMKEAKVYIDFGHFPGKDRLSREAAMNNVVILTGREGASKYYEDVTIPSQYKFEVKKENIGKISSHLKDCLRNYPLHNPKFDLYRNRIIKEEEEFTNQIIKTFFLCDQLA